MNTTMELPYTETKNGFTLTVDCDPFADNPTNWGVFDMHIWNGRFNGHLVAGENLDHFQTDNEKWTSGTLSKLRAGILYPVKVRSYSNSDGGLYSLTQLENADGFIELTDAKKMQPYEREILAQSCLEKYQQWANGVVYRVDIVEDETGEWIDGSGDCYGLEETLEQAKATLDNLAGSVRDSARAKKAQELHR